MTEIRVARPPYGICLEIFEHWQELCRSPDAVGRIPVRHQMDLLTLPRSTIPHFTLVEQIGDRYRGRFCGTAAADSLGVEITGRFLDELIDPDVYEDRKVLFDRCINDAVPVHYRARLARPRMEHLAFSRMLLPLRSTAGSQVNMAFGVIRFLPLKEYSRGDASIFYNNERLAIMRKEYREGLWTSF